MSPLRYPGSKKRLAPLIVDIVRRHDFDLFVEPFAGGAYIGLFMAKNNLAKKVVLGESDPLVASFWKALFGQNRQLAQRVRELEISIGEWRRIREWRPETTLDKAIKCLYLNRTNYSGILKAGPLGGKGQSGPYDIGCRFDKEKIARRIEALGSLGERVEVIRADYRETLAKTEGQKRFIYLDPPYYEKGHLLYNDYFGQNDHIELRDVLARIEDAWLLSYDEAPDIKRFYEGFPMESFALYHSATKLCDRPKKRELLISNRPLAL